MKVRGLITETLFCCKQTDTTQHVAEMMRMHDIGAVPALDNNDERKLVAITRAQWEHVQQSHTIAYRKMVRKLEPVMDALMDSGRNASGIASVPGSMQITYQIDALRPLRSDPIRKLVTPCVHAAVIRLLSVTILSGGGHRWRQSLRYFCSGSMLMTTCPARPSQKLSCSPGCASSA